MIKKNKKLIKVNKKKRNPQDSTRRNIQSSNKRFEELRDDIKELQKVNIERTVSERRIVTDKLNKISDVLKLASSDSASQAKALLQIKEILGW